MKMLSGRSFDDGGQSDYGDKAINRRLFPNGLDEIRSAEAPASSRRRIWAGEIGRRPRISNSVCLYTYFEGCAT